MINKFSSLRAKIFSGIITGLIICLAVYMSTTWKTVSNTTQEGGLCNGTDVLWTNPSFPASQDYTAGYPLHSIKSTPFYTSNCTAYQQKEPLKFYKLLTGWQFYANWLIYSTASFLVVYEIFDLRQRQTKRSS